MGSIFSASVTARSAGLSAGLGEGCPAAGRTTAISTPTHIKSWRLVGKNPPAVERRRDLTQRIQEDTPTFNPKSYQLMWRSGASRSFVHGAPRKRGARPSDGERAESSAAALRWGSGGGRRNLAMNRGQWIAVAGGAAVGLIGVAAGVALSRARDVRRRAAGSRCTACRWPAPPSSSQLAQSNSIRRRCPRRSRR